MKKLLSLILLASIVLLCLPGCTSTVKPLANSNYITEVTGDWFPEDSPLMCQPAFVKMTGVRVGETLSNWTSDGHFNIGDVTIKYERGGQMFLLLYNNTDEPLSVKLTKTNYPGMFSQSKSETPVTIHPAPGKFMKQLDFPAYVDIAPHDFVKIPLSFEVVNDEYPDAWEFGIIVAANRTFEHQLRFVIYMEGLVL